MKLCSYKQIICIISSVFTLSSCDYSPKSFPDKFIVDYELAIPIADTVITFMDIAFPSELSSVIDDDEEVLASAVFGPYELSYPFYVADFTQEGQVIDWVEPKAIINSSFLDKTDFRISFYMDNENGYSYTLGKDMNLVTGDNVLFGNKESRVDFNTYDELRGINKVRMVIILTVNDDLTMKDLKNSRSHVKVGVKFKMKMGFLI